MPEQPRPRKERGEKVNLPLRSFLYTLDQIAVLLAMPQKTLKARYIHFEFHTIGAHKRDMLLARNIGRVNSPPDWRVTEAELIRWLRGKNFQVIETAWVGARQPPRP